MSCLSSETDIKIAETFVSIQGEGPLVGEPTFFLRVSGCDKKCSWCDEKQHKYGEERSLESIAKEIYSVGLPVCITGGEPWIHRDNLALLVENAFFDFTIETHGQYYPFEHISWTSVLHEARFVVTSPKLPSSGEQPSIHELRGIFHEFQSLFRHDTLRGVIKLVVSDAQDFEYFKSALLPAMSGFVLQPEEGSTWLQEQLQDLGFLQFLNQRKIKVIPQCHKILKTQ